MKPGPAGAPSPLDLAKKLEEQSLAPRGSAAALVLAWWRARRLAFAMGTHARLGALSVVHKLSGAPDVCELIMTHVAGA